MINKYYVSHSRLLINCLAIIFLINCIFLSSEIIGQTKAKSDVQKFKDVKTWYLYFKVTVKGHETNSFTEGGGYDSISWKIDDKFSGNVGLDVRVPYTKQGVTSTKMSPMEQAKAVMAQLDNLFQWTHFPAGVQRMGPFNGLMPLHIKIDEMIVDVGKDPCGDDMKTTTRSFGEGDDFSYEAPFLKTDLGSLTYNVIIPLKPESDQKSLKKTQEVTEKNNGQVKTTNESRDIPFKLYDTLPKLGLLIENGKIRHKEDRPLNAVDNTWDFDSGDLEPDKPLINGVPDSKTKVKIHIYYKFSRTSITEEK